MTPALPVAQPVSPDEAVRLARDLYGLEVSAQPLAGEYDHNFRVTAADGRGFVLKIMHPGREQSLIDLQCQALQHLARRAPHLALPRVKLTAQGQAFTKVALHADEPFAWLLTFLPATVLPQRP